MATVSTSSKQIRAHDALRTNSVDLVSSLIVALLVFVSLVVTLLLILYLTKQFTYKPKTLTLIDENISGRGENAPGFERDLEPPGEEEIEELQEPTLEQTLEAVTEALSTVTASLDSLNASLESSAGAGKGDSRPPGPEGEGEDIVPRFERWKLKFTSRGLKQYSAQLDFFKIELGAAGGTKFLDYASSFSSTPKTRSITDPHKNEKRIYFRHLEENTLKQWDLSLLQKAGVATGGRQVFKFISKELEEELAQAEARYALEKLNKSDPIHPRHYEKTIFEVKAVSGGYEWEVIEQRYRLLNELK